MPVGSSGTTLTLICPNLDAANTLFNGLKMTALAVAHGAK
jgi:phosphotransacetylase